MKHKTLPLMMYSSISDRNWLLLSLVMLAVNVELLSLMYHLPLPEPRPPKVSRVQINQRRSI